MSIGTLIAEEDWAGRPATKGDLVLVQTHLEGKIKDVEGKIKDVEGMVKDVEGKVKDVEGMVKDVEGKMKDLRVDVSNVDTSLRSEIAKLRVSMVWMTVAVATGLGGLITVFEFLS